MIVIVIFVLFNKTYSRDKLPCIGSERQQKNNLGFLLISL